MFHINRPICDTHGTFDEDLAADYMDDAVEVFGKSSEFRLFELAYGDAGYSYLFLDFAFYHLGVALPKLTERDFNEILFGLFPRKVSAEAESAAIIVAELRAFFTFLDREYGLANARQFCALLNDKAKHKLQESLADPSNFGTAKSVMMLGTESGFDMTTPEGMNAFLLEFNKGHRSDLANKSEPIRLGVFDAQPDFLRFEMQPSGTRADHDKIRKARKAQRKARKKNRK